MGDCYSVTMKLKLREGRSTKANLRGLLRKWMAEKAKPVKDIVIMGKKTTIPGVDWALSTYREAGIRPDSFSGICKILLAFHQRNCKHFVDNDGFDVYRSGFNASYGWNSVMIEAFEEMSWALDEGSYLEIYRDEGHEIYEIRIDEYDGESQIWESHRPLYRRR